MAIFSLTLFIKLPTFLKNTKMIYFTVWRWHCPIGRIAKIFPNLDQFDGGILSFVETKKLNVSKSKVRLLSSREVKLETGLNFILVKISWM